MDLSVIKSIQTKCCKFHNNEEKRVYGGDMVAFYEILDTIDKLFNFMEEGLGVYIKMDEKYIPVLEGYLNMFCEPAKCRFIITKCVSEDIRTKLHIKMVSLQTDKVFKR